MKFKPNECDKSDPNTLCRVDVLMLLSTIPTSDLRKLKTWNEFAKQESCSCDKTDELLVHLNDPEKQETLGKIFEEFSCTQFTQPKHCFMPGQNVTIGIDGTACSACVIHAVPTPDCKPAGAYYVQNNKGCFTVYGKDCSLNYWFGGKYASPDETCNHTNQNCWKGRELAKIVQKLYNVPGYSKHTKTKRDMINFIQQWASCPDSCDRQTRLNDDIARTIS
jgi:hypothetical protein